jgi:hypothetical protein
MPFDLDEAYAGKHSIVDEFFIKTADDNYIAARWCFTQGLNIDFFWLGVHSLEKYLKVALLLNDRSARAYGHNIIRLYAAVYPLAPELLPNDLVQPAQLEISLWRAETVEHFVERLYHDGQAANRYQVYGYVRRAEDICKLDQVIYAVRQLCQSLESHFLTKKGPGVPDESRRERMRTDHYFKRLNSKLEETIAGRRGDSLQRVLLNWNFPFAPEGYEHSAYQYEVAAQNPVLVRRILDPLGTGPQAAREADELWEWVKSNIFLPRELIKEIDAARKERKDQSQARAK